jgi:hypothetical protein
VNPLIEALDQEIRFLLIRNVTWRFWNRSLEFIGPPLAYLDASGRLILDDLIRSVRARRTLAPKHVDLDKRLSRHGELINAVLEAAAAYHDWLLRQPELRTIVSEALAEYVRAAPPHAPPVWGSFREDQLPELVANNLVNHVGDLPFDRTDAAFWKVCSRLLRGRIPPNPGPDEFVRLNEACDRAARDAHGLVESLEDLRFGLCEEFDIPAAPMLGSSD